MLVFALTCGSLIETAYLQAPFKSTLLPYFVASGHFAQRDLMSLVIMHGRVIRILWSRKVTR